MRSNLPGVVCGTAAAGPTIVVDREWHPDRVVPLVQIIEVAGHLEPDELEFIPTLTVKGNAFFAVPTFTLERFGGFTKTVIVRYKPTLCTKLSLVYIKGNTNPHLEPLSRGGRRAEKRALLARFQAEAIRPPVGPVI